MSKFCSNCGNQLADDAKFCISCGHPVSIGNTVAPQQSIEPQQPTVSQQPIEHQQPILQQQPTAPVYSQPIAMQDNPVLNYAEPVANTKPPRNNNVVWAIIVGVLALILIGGIIFLSVKLISNKDDNSDDKKGKDNSTSVSASGDQSSQEDSSEEESSEEDSSEEETDLSSVSDPIIDDSYRKIFEYEARGLENNDWDTYKKALTADSQEQLKELLGSGEDYLDMAYLGLVQKIGTGFKVLFEISNETELNKDEIKEIEEAYKLTYSKSITIEKAYRLNINFIYSNNDKSQSVPANGLVILVDGNWYDVTGLK